MLRKLDPTSVNLPGSTAWSQSASSLSEALTHHASTEHTQFKRSIASPSPTAIETGSSLEEDESRTSEKQCGEFLVVGNIY